MEGTLQSRPTPDTRDGDEGGYLEPWDGSSRFCCLLQCSNSRCLQVGPKPLLRCRRAAGELGWIECVRWA